MSARTRLPYPGTHPVSSQQPQSARKTLYLRYPVEAGPDSRVTLVEKPGPGCYWGPKRTTRTGPEAGIREHTNGFDVPRGPCRGLELRHDEDGQLVLVEPKTSHWKAKRVGKIEKWEDENEGP